MIKLAESFEPKTKKLAEVKDYTFNQVNQVFEKPDSDDRKLKHQLSHLYKILYKIKLVLNHYVKPKRS